MIRNDPRTVTFEEGDFAVLHHFDHLIETGLSAKEATTLAVHKFWESGAIDPALVAYLSDGTLVWDADRSILDEVQPVNEVTS